MSTDPALPRRPALPGFYSCRPRSPLSAKLLSTNACEAPHPGLFLSYEEQLLLINKLIYTYFSCRIGSSLVAQLVKNLPAVQETRVQSVGQEDPWRRKWPPTPGFLPGESHGQRSLVGYCPRGRKSRTGLSD